MKKLLQVLILIFFLFPFQIFSQNFQDAFTNLTFSEPVGIYAPTDGTDRLFVVEQSGKIIVFENNRQTTQTKEFLDISDLIISGGEEGLLGLAFHPDYSSNGYFYVDYTATNPLRTEIARFQVSSTNPDSAIKSSQQVVLTFSQPYSNHNGGQLAFGPDGYLYIGTGDGGSEGDPNHTAQNLQLLLGKILRIDIDTSENGMNYGIPPTNPFYGNTQGYMEEIYSYGMRNPWRFSFDPVTGILWCGDVGQNNWEEIDNINNGKNYGWSCYEGFVAYNLTGCNAPEYIFPLFVYDHSGGRCAITGGFLYRGNRRAELKGYYVYGDYCSAQVWKFNPSDSSNYSFGSPNSLLLSFGVDKNNELYACTSSGKIYEPVPDINAPSNLILGSPGPGEVTLQWTDNSNNETGFYIQRKGTNNIFETIDSSGANTTSYTDNLSQTDTFTYRVIAHNTASVSDYSNESSIVVTDLPVEISSFTASVGNNYVLLKWTTASEKNNRGFEVERYFRNSWSEIGFVNSKDSTGTGDFYQYKDDLTNVNIKGNVLYRIKQIDYDGSFSFSNTISINLNFSGLSYNLLQNYPNPFNPSTNINYDLPEQSKVKLQVIDLLGRVVAELTNRIKIAGAYKQTWNAESFPSGVYYVRMTAHSIVSNRNFSKTIKVVYLK